MRLAPERIPNGVGGMPRVTKGSGARRACHVLRKGKWGGVGGRRPGRTPAGKVAGCDLTRQVPHARRATRAQSAQAEYSVHQDVDQDKGLLSPVLTGVYLLSSTRSCFQVVGFSKCDFDRAGRGYGFLSKCWHGTGATDPQTLKVAAFWGAKSRK